MPGARGKKASTFNVLQIATYLSTENLLPKKTIIHMLNKCYPATAEMFSDYMDN
jgi:hypothetical protein